MPLGSFGRVMPKDYSSIKRDFCTNPFGSALWHISSFGLIRLVKASIPNVRILNVIDISFILKDLLFNIIGYLRKSDATVKNCDVNRSFVMERGVFNLIELFTTILAERRG
jgi:hypothetical protein